jgi:hypothetical protein
VAFSIQNPTGGGETISPVYVLTNDIGIATSTFTSGSLSSGGSGVIVEASVVGMPAITPSTLPIVIGGTAASVTIGTSTTIESILNDTAYKLPMSVMVTDSNGNPISGADVSLGVWPSSYAEGYWEEISADECTPTLLRVEAQSEDDTYTDNRRRNVILDPGEDINGDGQLTPPRSAAGSLPATVETDENGAGNFSLVFLKESAGWIEAEVVASTVVQGTETRSTYKFWLPYMETEDCELPNSPYN